MALPYTYSSSMSSCGGPGAGCCSVPNPATQGLCPDLPLPPDTCAPYAPGLPAACPGGVVSYGGIEVTTSALPG